MTSTVTRIQLRTLSTSTTDPNKSGELMLEAAKQSVKSTRRMQAFNLVRGLKTRRVGTHVVEKAAKTLTQEKERNESVVNTAVMNLVFGGAPDGATILI